MEHVLQRFGHAQFHGAFTVGSVFRRSTLNSYRPELIGQPLYVYAAADDGFSALSWFGSSELYVMSFVLAEVKVKNLLSASNGDMEPFQATLMIRCPLRVEP